MLKMSKSFVVRMVLWCLVMLYLVLDLFVFTGPVRQLFPTDEQRRQAAIKDGVCARVHGSPIYIGQVDRRVRENLWRGGRDAGKVTEAEMKLLRWVALNELIDEHILRIKVRVNREQYEVTGAEVDAELGRFEKRFATADELDKAMAAQGIESRKELRYRLAARLQQEKYVEKQIEDAIAVKEPEVKQWYDEHQEEMMTPERRRVRHVFLASLDHPSDEAKARLAEQMKLISEKKKKFEEVAKELSEDLRSKEAGGDLGWMRRDRLPGDFAAVVFAMPLNELKLFRTKLGWHIVEVTEMKPRELPAFDAVKDEVRRALSDSRRKAAVRECRRQLRWLERERVVIYREVLDNG